MANLKKINIYVGVVGQAYVDKATAQINLEHARQNVLDWKEIVNIADRYKNIAEEVRIGAENALTNAQELNNRINEAIYQYNDNDEIRNQLEALKLNLITNDNDADNTNGGNVNTANINVDRINNIINELIELYNGALNYKTSAEEAVSRYEEIYNNAVEAFNSYIPEGDQQSDLDESDELEAQYKERLEELYDNIQDVIETTNNVNTTTSEVNEQVNNITGNEQPEEPVVEGKLFAIGPDEITADNYTTANGAQRVTSYPTSYESVERKYLYCLLANDKSIQFIEPTLNAPIDIDELEINIDGYKVYKSTSKIMGVINLNIA